MIFIWIFFKLNISLLAHTIKIHLVEDPFVFISQLVNKVSIIKYVCQRSNLLGKLNRQNKSLTLKKRTLLLKYDFDKGTGFHSNYPIYVVKNSFSCYFCCVVLIYWSAVCISSDKICYHMPCFIDHICEVA